MDAPHDPARRRPGRLAALVASLCLAATVVGCGADQTSGRAAAGTNPTPSTTDGGPDRAPSGAVALVVTDDGLAGVPVGSATPSWVTSGAVAAPDGSAVFATKALAGAVQLLRLDPLTGVATQVGQPIAGPAGLHVAAVAPGGERVALAGPSGDPERTVIVDFDAAKGDVVREPTFEGTLEPEAYSLDRTLLFAARIYGDRYHVHGLDLVNEQQWPTLGPNKTAEPEDMYGSVVQAALSPDGKQLATLYRDSVRPEHSAFVHLLSLENGTTVCIDLHAPFGGDEPGRDAIEWQDDGAVAVGHRADDPRQSMTATFDPQEIWSGEPQPHYHAEALPDPNPPSIPDGVGETPGFRRFVALVNVRR